MSREGSKRSSKRGARAPKRKAVIGRAGATPLGLNENKALFQRYFIRGQALVLYALILGGWTPVYAPPNLSPRISAGTSSVIALPPPSTTHTYDAAGQTRELGASKGRWCVEL